MSRYIDADALIKRIQDEHKFGSLMLSNMIAEMPTTDVVEKEKWNRLLENSIILADAVQKYQLADVVEHKRGEWIERNVTQDRRDAKIPEWQSAKCSVCGKYHTTPYMYYFTNYDYCPNCGADMRGEDDEQIH